MANQIDEWEKFRTGKRFEFAEKGYDHPITDWSWRALPVLIEGYLRNSGSRRRQRSNTSRPVRYIRLRVLSLKFSPDGGRCAFNARPVCTRRAPDFCKETALLILSILSEIQIFCTAL